MNASSLLRLTAALFLLAGLPLDALAQRTGNVTRSEPEIRRVVRLGNNTTTTSISGLGSSQHVILRGDNNYVLKGLYFSERSDEPCHVRAAFVTARHGSSEPAIIQEGTDETDELCAVTSNDLQTLVLGNTTAPLEAIHAVQVGMNRRGDKIKAVAVFGSTIDQDASGDVRRDAGLTESFDRPNFREPWKTKVSCGAGQVAVGVVIYFQPVAYSQRNASIQGIALECADVTVREFAYRPGTNDRVVRVN